MRLAIVTKILTNRYLIRCFLLKYLALASKCEITRLIKETKCEITRLIKETKIFLQNALYNVDYSLKYSSKKNKDIILKIKLFIFISTPLINNLAGIKISYNIHWIFHDIWSRALQTELFILFLQMMKTELEFSNVIDKNLYMVM